MPIGSGVAPTSKCESTLITYCRLESGPLKLLQVASQMSETWEPCCFGQTP